jgi:hypothetical protein
MKNRFALLAHRRYVLAGLAGLASLGLACTESNPNTGPGPGGDMAMAPSPVLTSVSPASGPTKGMTTLTLTGDNFRSGAAVTVGGLPCGQVTVVAPNQITCQSPTALGKSGKVDVVVTQEGQITTLPQSFSYYLSMISFQAMTRLQTPTWTRSLVLGDWNRDSKLDLATANETASSVSVRMGGGDGTFSGTTDYSYAAGAGGPYMIASADA